MGAWRYSLLTSPPPKETQVLFEWDVRWGLHSDWIEGHFRCFATVHVLVSLCNKSLMLWVPDFFTQGQADQRIKLNTYLYLAVRLRIYGTLPPPLCMPLVYDI